MFSYLIDLPNCINYVSKKFNQNIARTSYVIKCHTIFLDNLSVSVGQDSSLFQSGINQLDFHLTWSPSREEGITWEY